MSPGTDEPIAAEMANARHILARGINHLPHGPHVPHAGQRFASPDDVVVQGTPA